MKTTKVVIFLLCLSLLCFGAKANEWMDFGNAEEVDDFVFVPVKGSNNRNFYYFPKQMSVDWSTEQRQWEPSLDLIKKHDLGITQSPLSFKKTWLADQVVLNKAKNFLLKKYGSQVRVLGPAEFYWTVIPRSSAHYVGVELDINGLRQAQIQHVTVRVRYQLHGQEKTKESSWSLVTENDSKPFKELLALTDVGNEVMDYSLQITIKNGQKLSTDWKFIKDSFLYINLASMPDDIQREIINAE